MKEKKNGDTWQPKPGPSVVSEEKEISREFDEVFPPAGHFSSINIQHFASSATAQFESAAIRLL